MVSTTGLGTPLIPAILEDTPVSADKNLVDLLGHNTCITIPNPARHAGALVPGARNSQSPGPSKVLEDGAVLTTEISCQTMATNRYLIIVAQYNVIVSPWAFAYFRHELGVEYLSSFTNIGTSIHSNKKHKAKSTEIEAGWRW